MYRASGSGCGVDDIGFTGSRCFGSSNWWFGIWVEGVGLTSAPSARAVSDKGGAGRKRTIEEEKSVHGEAPASLMARIRAR